MFLATFDEISSGGGFVQPLKETPMISIIIPVYNGERYLEEAFRSIEQQTWPVAYEILVVDDGSTDRSNEIARKYDRVKIFSQPNQGPAAARNRGIDEAKGEMIAFLDADDQWTLDKIAIQYDFLSKNPTVGVVLGYIQSIIEEGREAPDYTGPFCGILLGSSLMRKEVFDQVGKFDPSLRFGEDLDWFVRAREKKVSIAILEQVMLRYRLHTHNMTYQKSSLEMGTLKILHRSIQRRKNELLPVQHLKPLVSAIVPVYNGERYLRQALDSIERQSYRPIEIILIDDGSSDRSIEIAKRYSNIRCIHQKNEGVAAARIRGIQEAKGEFIAFLDQDDYWTSDKIAKQIQTIRDNPSLQFVNGLASYFTDANNPPPSNFKTSLLESTPPSFLPGAILAKKTLFEKIPIDPKFKHGSDISWAIQAKEQNIPFQTLPSVVLRVRVHGNNNSHNTQTQYGELLLALKDSLKRKQPLVSVIIPVYNCEKYLNEAIESVLNQTHRAIELIVVDDGSTDRSAEIAAQYGSKLRIARQTNQGIGAARNRGIEMAAGSYLAFLDSDDLWTESKLEMQLQEFQRDPALDMIFGESIHFFSPDLDPASLNRYKEIPTRMKSFFAGTMLIKKSSFDRVGLFSTSHQIGEYIDWYCRAQEKKLNQSVLNEVFLKRRIHGENTSLKKKQSQADYLKVLHESLQRRKALA